MDINRIISIIRNLKEEVPANNASSGGIAGLPPDQPPGIPASKKKKRYVFGGKGSRKIWLQHLDGKS
tara:strand:+ start:128 stop:328 length:201 start_codon:yes stop_codon:yes gene_type:complete